MKIIYFRELKIVKVNRRGFDLDLRLAYERMELFSG